jgi:hypothetical protein
MKARCHYCYKRRDFEADVVDQVNCDSGTGVKLATLQLSLSTERLHPGP